MALLIQNGEIVTADSRYVADIWCENETITAIGKNLPVPQDAHVIDARGKLVFPGFVDPHTHIYLYAMGTYAKDTYETGTIAALCGGTTTLIDFVNPQRQEGSLEALEKWRQQTVNPCCDYTCHMTVSHLDAQIENELREVVLQHGITSFKIFFAYKDFLGMNDGDIYKTLLLAKELGVVTAAHCENAHIIDIRQQQFVDDKKLTTEYHHHSRPPILEAEGTHRLCVMSELIGGEVYVVHLSCEEALQKVIAAKMRGVNIHAETLIQYLLLDKSHAELPNFEGAKYIMSPPLRDKKNQKILWNALHQGFLATVATDHAPFDWQQRQMGKENFCNIPNGIPSLEDRIRLLYTHGVNTGKIDIHRFVDVASTRAAKIFGLFPRKGTIQVGCDADLVIYDPHVEETISANTHHMNIDYSVFEGIKVKGRCHAVTVRGHVQVRDGQFTGQKGIGKFLKRQPRSH
ncbi:dihydropyrimidinase [Candidatus Uabimicrobium amorphum]|uniref:Dihydropyrimidinase n=1 Tax=Uabimicrobium amorphum TaxID=2596890 RepID=A0A5S9IMD8_UABAM|nr:dihydropyrimidinase [Candidatus Uabimicrobium amorphum]BBM84106.1 dihydropyrimidinase [Candidatus Uabimicrobium amorphum]